MLIQHFVYPYLICSSISCNRFIKALVQEFSIRLDKGFVLSLYEMFSPWLPEEKPSVRIRQDITTLHQQSTAKVTKI